MTDIPEDSIGINPRLVEVTNQLLNEVFGEPTTQKSKKAGRKSNAEKEAEAAAQTEGKVTYSLEDKLKVIDRATKLEALRLKVDGGGEGTGFND